MTLHFSEDLLRETLSREFYFFMTITLKSSTPENSFCTFIYFLSQNPSKLDEHNLLGTAIEIRTTNKRRFLFVCLDFMAYDLW